MKDKKGFTLVELLATIILLALLMMIAIPAFSKYILRTEENYYKSLEKTIKSAAAEYMNQNKSLFPRDAGDYYIITKDELINSGLLDEIKDKNGKDCTSATIYVVKEKDGKYRYDVILECSGYKSKTKVPDEVGKNNDQSIPIVGLPIKEKSTTNSITIKADCKDPETGIREYLYSNDGGNTYVSGGKRNTYTFNSLENLIDYSFKVKCINGANLEGESQAVSFVTASLLNPTISLIGEEKIENFEWSFQKTVEILYNNSNIETPHYYVMSSVDLKIDKGIIINKCNKGASPTNCIYSNSDFLEKDIWYEIKNSIQEIKYGKYETMSSGVLNGTIYAGISDGTSFLGGSSYNITKVDGFKPTITSKETFMRLGSKDYNFNNNINVVYGVSGGSFYCDPQQSKKTGNYNVTCTVTGNNGLASTTTFKVAHSYLATVSSALIREVTVGEHVFCPAFWEDMSCCAGYLTGTWCDVPIEKAVWPCKCNCNYHTCFPSVINPIVEKHPYCINGATLYGNKCYACPNGGKFNSSNLYCEY